MNIKLINLQTKPTTGGDIHMGEVGNIPIAIQDFMDTIKLITFQVITCLNCDTFSWTLLFETNSDSLKGKSMGTLKLIK